MNNIGKKNIFGIFTFFIILLFVLAVPVKADSGWDTGYGGGSYGGGYDSGWSSGSSWDYNDYDWGSHSGGYSSNSSSEPDPMGAVIIFICNIVIVVFIIIVKIYLKENGESPSLMKTKTIDYEQYRNYGDRTITDIPLEELKKVLPNYTLNELKEMAVNKFIQIQNAWMDFDYDTLRSLCTDELYNAYLAQLKVLKAKNGKNMMRDFKTIYILVTEAHVENEICTVKFNFRVEFYDYVIDEKTKKVTRGTDKRKIMNTYTLEFVKGMDKDITKCPHCGARFDAVTSTECEYCGSTIVKNASDFVLSKKTKI